MIFSYLHEREGTHAMEDQQIEQKPRYFMAIFGKAYAATASVNGGHYRPYKGWFNNIGICPGDRILLYCAKGYSTKYSKVAQGTGRVSHVAGSTVYYNHASLPFPVPLSIVRGCFTPADKDKLGRIHFRKYRLFEIERPSFCCVLQKAKSMLS